MATYGSSTLILNLGLRREFLWKFILADVNIPIIGADFLAHFNLIPDCASGILFDNVTRLKTSCTRRPTHQSSVKMVTVDDTVLNELVMKYPDVAKPACTKRQILHDTLHFIKTVPGPPVHSRFRRLAPDRYLAAKAVFDAMLAEGIARRSDSPWSAPLHMVRKKDDSWRPCGDYRLLNARTIPDRYPVRHIHDFNVAINGCKVFSTIDLIKAYTQIPVNPADVPKTAITTPFGLFEFPFMSFGLRNAGQTFQRFIDAIFQDLPFCYAYVDDILIFSRTMQEHKQHLEEIFERLQRHGILINVNKCVIARESLVFLGYSLSSKGVTPNPDKIESILKIKLPHDSKSLRRFLGIINFYRRFIPHAAEIQAPLFKMLTPRNTTLSWNEDLILSFEHCKQSLADATLLEHPDHESVLSLFTDASSLAVGAALQQFTNEQWKPLAFFSKGLSTTQQRWPTLYRELLAIYLAIRHFRHSLEGRHFTIFSDHKPLSFLFEKANASLPPVQMNQLTFISQFTTDIKFVRGIDNIPADIMSRDVVQAITPNILNIVELAELQDQDDELQRLTTSNETSMRLSRIYIPAKRVHIWCDCSTNVCRPYVPPPMRKTVFNYLHELSHPGIRASVKLISRRFVWSKMRRDIVMWTRACVKCQQHKITRHVHASLGQFPHDCVRLHHLHIDLIGPMPSSNGFKYCLTMIDRGSKWPEVIPLRNISTEAIINVFVETWISRYGVPHTITTDQGRQFQSVTFNKLCSMFGIRHIQTTAYHPQSNGKVERFHRALKFSFSCGDVKTWSKRLPLVMLGLRCAYSNDLHASPAEMLYGQCLTLPYEMLHYTPDNLHNEPSLTLQWLRSTLRELIPAYPPESHGSRKVFVFADLKTCTHVYLRKEGLRASLSPAYSGPHQIMHRDSKTLTILVAGKETVVSIDRCKPAYLLV